MYRTALLLLLASSCKKVEPAPTDLDGALHYLWRYWQDGDEAQLAEATRNIHAAVDGDTLSDTLDGTLDPLSLDEGELVRDGVDASEAQGLYMVRPLACDLDQLEAMTIALDQAADHPDAYESYDRTYTSDVDDYTSRRSPFLTWDIEYHASVLGAEYTGWVEGGVRHVPDQGAEITPDGPLLLARAYMPKPVQYENETDKSFTQDYQLELFYERAPGDILHAYAMWRQADFGYADLENTSVQRLVLNALSDWDDETEAACAEDAR